MIRFSVSTYSFSQLAIGSGMTQLQMIGKAKELGFDAIEFHLIRPEGNLSEKEYASLLGEECEKQGIAVANLTLDADLLTGSGNSTEREVERLMKQVDLAETVGAKSIRHDATRGFPAERKTGNSFEDALPILADACRTITGYAAEKGIRTMVENHGYFCQHSARVEKLVKAVDHKNFGWLVDMGNFLCADEDPLSAVKRGAKYAFYVHAKDFIVKDRAEADPGRGFFPSAEKYYLRGTIAGQGSVPVFECMKILRDAKYSGYIGLEFEGVEPCLYAIETGLENLRCYAERLDF